MHTELKQEKQYYTIKEKLYWTPSVFRIYNLDIFCLNLYIYMVLPT